MTSSTKSFENKKARFDYEILETVEAGIALTGDEVKAIRNGRVNMTGSYGKIFGGEIFWVGGNFNMADGDSQRTRKLLLHKDEIKRLVGKSQEQGFTLIPIKLYLKRGKAKLELGLGKGKKIYDKRAVIKKRESDIEISRSLKNR